MPRLIAMYGPVGYRYSGVVHPPQPLTARLEAIRAAVEAATGLAFNSVLANLYRDGRDSVGWHRDSDYAHGGRAAIASMSFGAVRRFELRERVGHAGPPRSTWSPARCCSWTPARSHAGGIGCRRRRARSGRAST
jgi:alkylated DNA repair dioxygenase AlkB